MTLNRDAMPQEPIRLVLLHDAQGRALAMLPTSMMLNLVGIWKSTKRKLQPYSPEEVRAVFSKWDLETAAGQQHLRKMEVLMDPACGNADQLELYEPYSERSFCLEGTPLRERASILPLGLSTREIDARQPVGSDAKVIALAVERFTELRIKQRLEDTLGMPSLPPTSQKILKLRGDPLAGVDDLLPIVEIDPSLSAQVMSWAASPYYAAPGSIQSIHDAIVRVLGFDLVVNLALGIAMGKTLDVPKDTARNSTPYWLQAVFCASLMEKLVRKIPPAGRPRTGLAYLSGLLHNFGYLALAHIFPPHFSLLCRHFEANPTVSHLHVERQILNVTRDQVGAWLMESWNLPKEVCHAIRYQHEADYDGPNAVYANLLYLAQGLMRQSGLGDGPREIPEELYARLSLSPDNARDAFAQVDAKRDDLLEMTRMMKRH